MDNLVTIISSWTAWLCVVFLLIGHDQLQVAALDTKVIVEDEFEIGYIQSLKLETPPLASMKSSFQEIEIYESKHFGKVFTLDECLQLTERDAPHYNEMVAHVPVMEYLIHHEKIEPNDDDSNKALNVLVIGGGDGYVISELLKHSFIESIDQVELDEVVIQASNDYFPWAKGVWDHNKVKLFIEDGAKFVQDKAAASSSYDIIIQDSSDPFYRDDDDSMKILPSSVLYSKTHFEALYQLLKPKNGVLLFQAETYNIPSNLVEIRKWREVLSDIGFTNARYGSISTPTYPTGQIGFYVTQVSETVDETCEKNVSSTIESLENSVRKELQELSIISKYYNAMTGKTAYYHPKVHRSAFDLPLWVHEAIY